VYKILIAEDQAIIAFCIEQTIQGFGPYATACVGSVSAALALIQRDHWDAAILDLGLAQRETAYPVADQLAAIGVPFAFATGWDGPLPGRFSDVPVLRKPFGDQDLERCLEMLLRKTPNLLVEQLAA
jgi:CheY-like chemotaxis protein